MVIGNVTVNMTQLGMNVSNTFIPQTRLITIHQISIAGVILNFLIYLVIHIIIGTIVKKKEKLTVKTEEDLKELKIYKLIFKWWPAIYLIIILVQYG